MISSEFPLSLASPEERWDFLRETLRSPGWDMVADELNAVLCSAQAALEELDTSGEQTLYERGRISVVRGLRRFVERVEAEAISARKKED